jgi:hypothetical protein
MSCVKTVSDFQQIALEGTSHVAHQTGFFFNIPESIMLPSYEKNMPQNLPPSIRVQKPVVYAEQENYRSAVSGNCDVSYHIEARALMRGQLVCHTSREIIVIPVADIPPPLEPEDLKREYLLAAASSPRSFWKPNKSATVVISCMEPRPLVFPTNEEDFGSTEVLLNFKTRGELNENSEMTGPQLEDLEVLITLEAITYFLEHEQESVMSVAEVLQSPTAVLKKTRYKTKNRKMHLAGWSKGREIACKYSITILLKPYVTDASF